MAIGLIVEGVYDEAIVREFIRRIVPDSQVLSRQAGGISALNKLFPVFLRELEHPLEGEPVAKALVLRDSDGKDPSALETGIANRIRGQTFAVPDGVQLHIVVQAVEAWLLADPTALNQVVQARGGTVAEHVAEPPESIATPKNVLARLLRDAGVSYTTQVGRDIAQAADLEILRQSCPSFAVFERKVIDC